MDSGHPDYNWATVEELLRALLSQRNTREMTAAIVVWTAPDGQVGHAYHSSIGGGVILSMLEIAKFSLLHEEAHRQLRLR